MSAPQLFQNTSVFNFIHKCFQYNYHCDYPSFLQAASANGCHTPEANFSFAIQASTLTELSIWIVASIWGYRWHRACSHTWCQERSYITNVGDLKLITLCWWVITNSSIPILELHSLNSMKDKEPLIITFVSLKYLMILIIILVILKNITRIS